MFRQFTVATAALAFALFAAPTWSLTDNPPPRVEQGDQTIEVARDREASQPTGVREVKKVEALAITRKGLQSSDTGESVDCFYEYNRALAECRPKISGH
jgi:hypothetical protein